MKKVIAAVSVALAAVLGTVWYRRSISEKADEG